MGNAPKPANPVIDNDDDDDDGFFMIPSTKEQDGIIDDQKIALAKLKSREAEFTTYKPLT